MSFALPKLQSSSGEMNDKEEEGEGEGNLNNECKLWNNKSEIIMDVC